MMLGGTHMTTWKGGCHCGQIAFKVDGEIDAVVECNCSHCRPKGYLLWFRPREALRLATPEADMGTYGSTGMPLPTIFARFAALRRSPMGSGMVNGWRQ